jgi:hypothetical protein
MKINTKIVLKDLQNKEIQNPDNTPFTFGEAVGNVIGQSKTGGKLKIFLLALKFAQEESFDLDDADLSLVKQAIESSDGIYSTFILGQLLQILESK